MAHAHEYIPTVLTSTHLLTTRREGETNKENGPFVLG